MAGKTAILTGVTGGWGRAVLDRFLDQGWNDERDDNKRKKELGDCAKPRVLDEILGVACAVSAADGREQPACVGVPESLQRLERSVSELGMRAVRVSLPVGELVVLAVVGDPRDHVALHTHLAKKSERVTNSWVRLEGPVREQTVVTDRDPDAGQEVADYEDRDRSDPDPLAPEKNDRDHQAGDRQANAEEIDQLVRPAHHCSCL